MEAIAKTKNVGTKEAILRMIIGVILVLIAFIIHGIPGWIIGIIGVALIVTAIFGY